MLKKAVLVAIFLIFISLLIVSAFMKNGDAKKITAQAKAEIHSETTVANKTPDEPLPELKNPRLVVKKADRKLEVFDGDMLVKTYRVGLGFAPEGDKEKQGDGKTPEGEFYIFTKNDKSKFYLSIGVSYPSTKDATRGLRDKLISQSEHDQIIEAINNKKTPLQNTALGGKIYIHGNGSASDWTLGCVALEDADMKELFDAIPVGTNVKIEP